MDKEDVVDFFTESIEEIMWWYTGRKNEVVEILSTGFWTVIGLIGYMILLITSPVWVLAYSIIKKLKKE